MVLKCLSVFTRCLWMTVIIAIIALVPEMVMAADYSTVVKGILQLEVVKSSITVGFAFYAFIKWIDFFQNFDSGKALTGIITPAILTFFAIKWQDVVKWIGFSNQ